MWPLRLKELRKTSGKTSLTFPYPSLPLQALERKTCALGSFRMVSLLVQRVEHLDSGIDDFHEAAVGIRNFLILETLFFAHKYFFSYLALIPAILEPQWCINCSWDQPGTNWCQDPGSGMTSKCLYSLMGSTAPGTLLARAYQHSPRQGSGTAWGSHFSQTIPTGNLDLDTLFQGKERFDIRPPVKPCHLASEKCP